MKTFRLQFLFPILFLLGSCTSSLVTIENDSYKDFDLSAYESFGFFEVNESEPDNPNFKKAVELLKQEISQAMESRGLSESSNPELKINLGLVVEDKVQTRETNLATDPFMYTGQRRYTWSVEEIPVGTYREGSLTMHLVDSNSTQAVWVGTIERVVPKKDEKKAEAIKFAVAELFKEIDN